jgi:hypothetical protein
VEDEDNPEEETDEITTMGKLKMPPARPHIINVENDNSEDETDEPAQTADIPEEWVEQDDALPTTPRTTTEEAAPIPPHEGLHRSRYLVKVCGSFTHGIWCDCPFIPKPSPRYHMETNLNVPQTLPTKPRKSDKIKQKEWDKTYGVPAVEVSKLGFPVDGTAYSARQIQAMMRKTLEVGVDETNAIKEVDHHQTSPGPEAGLRDQAGLCERQAHRPGRQTVLLDRQRYRDGDPHHAGTGPGAVADRAGLRDQCQDGDLHHAASMKDDQRVQPRPEPKNKMNMTLMKYRGPDVYEPKTKTVVRVILMPDKKDLQKPTIINRRGDTDDAEMIANDAHQQTMYETRDQEEGDDKPYQQTMYETHQEEGDDKPYPDIPAVSHAAPEKGEPNTQKRPCHKDVLDMTNVPGNTARDIFDTKHRTNVSDVQDVIMPDVPDVPRTTALATYDDKFAAILATYDEELAAATLATYDEEFAAILATYDEEFAATTLANYDEEFTAVLATYDEELAAATLTTYDDEFAAILATYDEEFAATTLANYDKEFAAAATLDTYDKEFAAATYDEEIAAVEGEPWGHN